MKTIRFDRLETLCRVNEERTDGRFTMECFGHPCGTPACLMGGYAARQDVQDEFVLSETGGILKRKYGYHCMLSDFAAHFGIRAIDAETLFNLFGCGGAKTIPAAVAYVRDFMRLYGWQPEPQVKTVASSGLVPRASLGVPAAIKELELVREGGGKIEICQKAGAQ